MTGAGGAAEVPVLVIGAGPSGLFAAIELARHGVQARVIEREPLQPLEARATALQPGTLEILARAGVLDRVLDESVQLRYARVFDSTLNPVSESAFAGAGCPWEFQCSLPQWRTEQILAERLADLGGSVERGVSAVSLSDHDDGVEVELARADGTPELVEAEWVIGAGGAHSVTRESMAGVLAGDTYPGTALSADVVVSCALPRDGSALIASPAGYVLLAPLPGERWITFIGDLAEDEAERLTRDTSVAALAASLERRTGSSVQLDEVGWASVFRMHNRAVPNLADRRRFLLGDAGHLSSPVGGEGLNSGLQDGHNLGWKLALELHGHARPGLLESFASSAVPPPSMFSRSPTASMAWPTVLSRPPGRAPASPRHRLSSRRPWSARDPCLTSPMRAARLQASTRGRRTRFRIARGRTLPRPRHTGGHRALLAGLRRSGKRST